MPITNFQTNRVARRELNQEREFSRANQISIKTVSIEVKLSENYLSTYLTSHRLLDLVVVRDLQAILINRRIHTELPGK
jgi:hypothetical protein